MHFHGTQRRIQMMNNSHLKLLEDESIYILRETAAQFERPVLLFSGGKDSIVMVHLAEKAFYPGRFPFPLMHIDTGHNFPETIAFRDELAARTGARLIIGSVEESISNGQVSEETGPEASRNALQTVTLLNTLKAHHSDCALGGGRRDEEKARAKERFFSHRDIHGQWDPRNQRPEVWNLYNGRKHTGEHFRVFPLSNWTEMDVWQYIADEKIPIPHLYFAHKRQVFNRRGTWLADTPYINRYPEESFVEKTVRFRTIGDATCTGAVLSNASSLREIIAEVAAARVTERGNRHDDKRSEAAMEDRKKAGYF
jgi:sulfate adenylyltransferase subunit 2